MVTKKTTLMIIAVVVVIAAVVVIAPVVAVITRWTNKDALIVTPPWSVDFRSRDDIYVAKIMDLEVIVVAMVMVAQ
ncbi:hypothetical protein F2Q69_00019325 [Brassica cretica]|uniref:Uncharacterized protein n=1 Tax=Brassica cretica TaxID=69181 RepID=A0A8S9QBW5_BRACR|nr:hypothetical protein F2Q69_00019325 [Brassica cretica]